MKKSLLALFAFCLSASVVYAQAGFDEGMSAYLEGDYTTALKEFRPLAEQGDAAAQYRLGVMYEEGEGVKQDDFKAFDWFRKKFMELTNQWIKQDYAKAVEWYTRAAEQGDDTYAQYWLEFMYRNGLGVKQDASKAVEWFTQAARQGHAEAQYNLGLMYLNGKGVRQDDFKAVEWFTRAAEGRAFYQNKLGDMYANGHGVRQDYVKAAEWAGRACDNGDQLGCDNYKKYKRRAAQP